jgi:putative flippase GtrA
LKRLAGFVFAGGVATAFNYSIFLVLLSLGWNPSLASAVGYVSGIGVSYSINKKFVFITAKKVSFLRYSLAYCFALVCQIGLLNYLISVSVDVRLSNLMAIVAIVFLNFLVMNKLVFRVT